MASRSINTRRLHGFGSGAVSFLSHLAVHHGKPVFFGHYWPRDGDGWMSSLLAPSPTSSKSRNERNAASGKSTGSSPSHSWRPTSYRPRSMDDCRAASVSNPFAIVLPSGRSSASCSGWLRNQPSSIATALAPQPTALTGASALAARTGIFFARDRSRILPVSHTRDRTSNFGR